jgi:hypothetical protein
MTERASTALDLLKRTESLLSALHGSVARHDNLAANLGCAGCELRDQIRGALPTLAAAPSSAPADRAAEWRAAADELGRMDYDADSNDYGYDTYRDAWNGGVVDGADMLRRLADEAQQQPETRPARGDQFEQWLKAQRDASADHPEAYQAADGLLDLYRLHADMGVPLGGHVCEGRVVGDCECLEQPAVVSAVPPQPEETACGPAPDACHVDGEPCANHERQQAHVEGEHCFCGPECTS